MRNIIIALLMIVSQTAVIAGTTDPEAKFSIKGQVTDENGQPLVGVEVVVEGLGKKVYTDFDGNFEVDQLKNGSYTLQFSYVAYKEVKNVFKTIQLANQNTIVKLKKKKLNFN